MTAHDSHDSDQTRNVLYRKVLFSDVLFSPSQESQHPIQSNKKKSGTIN
jgi:hypothetical protein